MDVNVLHTLIGSMAGVMSQLSHLVPFSINWKEETCVFKKPSRNPSLSAVSQQIHQKTTEKLIGQKPS